MAKPNKAIELAEKNNARKEAVANLAQSIMEEADMRLANQGDAIIETDTRNARQKISDTLEEYASALGYGGLDDMYAKFLLKKIFAFDKGAVASKTDDIALKYLSELSAVKGYKDANREYVIQTNIRSLNSTEFLKS